VDEDLADLRAYHGAKAVLAGGEDELMPAKYAKRLVVGESPLRV
jgi:mRNA interferase RelE/StbE